MRFSVAVALVFAAGATGTAAAQSLAAIAAQTARDTTAVRTYTNEDLVSPGGHGTTGVRAHTPTDDTTTTPEADTPSQSPKARIEENYGAGTVNINVAAERNDAALDEAYWRKGTNALRTRISQAVTDLAFIDAQIERVGGEPQTVSTARQQESLASARSRRGHDIALLEAALAAQLNRAHAIGVPTAWVR